MLILNIFGALVVGHALADYPLQGDFLSRGKSPHTPIPGIPWIWLLGFHSVIHAGAVALVLWLFHVPAWTLWWLAIGEFAAHAWTDLCKCRGEIGFTTDQIGHLICKLSWALAATVELGGV